MSATAAPILTSAGSMTVGLRCCASGLVRLSAAASPNPTRWCWPPWSPARPVSRSVLCKGVDEDGIVFSRTTTRPRANSWPRRRTPRRPFRGTC